MAFKFHRRTSSVPTDEKKITYTPAKRKLPRWQWYLLVLALFSPLVYFFGKLILSFLFINAEGYITTNSVNIRAPYDAYVENLKVQLSNEVKPGDLLVALDSPVLNAQIKSSQESIEHFQLMQQSHFNQTVFALRELEITAKNHVEETKKYYYDIRHTYKKGLTTVMDLSLAEERYNQAKVNLRQIQAAIPQNQENFSINAQRNYDQILGPLYQQLTALEMTRKGLQIKSKVVGVVTNLTTQKFEFVKQGMSLLTISTYENLHVTAFFDDKDIEHLYRGKKVYLLLPNFKIIAGHIANEPRMAKQETQMFLLLENPKHKLIAFIVFDEPLPKAYQVSGMFVRVILI